MKVGDVVSVNGNRCVWLGKEKENDVLLNIKTKELIFCQTAELIETNNHICFDEVVNGLENHSDYEIYTGCLSVLKRFNNQVIEYLDWVGVDQDDEEERWNIALTNSEVISSLFLQGTSHSGGSSTWAKCYDLGLDPTSQVYFGYNEEDAEEQYREDEEIEQEHYKNRRISQEEAYERRSEIKVGDKFLWKGFGKYATSGKLPSKYMALSNYFFGKKIFVVEKVYESKNSYGPFIDIYLTEDGNDETQLIVNGEDAFLMEKI